MKKFYITIIIASLFFSYCSNNKGGTADDSQSLYQLPRVLFITTGTDAGYGKLEQGAVIAIQSFNRKGAIVNIKSRDILNDAEQLNEYNFLVLSTSLGYHDADRRYSLSFMSDYEIENIRNFVEDGGVLIAGDNVGRNKLDGNDRISLYGRLTPENWGLSKCFGVSMQELNMKDYAIKGDLDSNLQGQFKATSPTDLWTLVGDSIHSSNLNVLAQWENEDDSYPAIIKNDYGKGISFLLASSYFLHPSNDGGFWSAAQIQSFYDIALEAFNKKNNNPISLNPWPNGYDHAFCVSLNATDSLDDYDRIENFLRQENIDATYFVSGKVKENVRNHLQKSNTQSNGAELLSYNRIPFPTCKNDIIANEILWEKSFSGFRFPYTRLHFWGLMALDELGYQFESSIGADNIEEYLGSVFPYHMPISNNSYYKTTNILEISPTYHDDYFFYKEIISSELYPAEQQQNDAKLFSKYLSNYWQYAVKPYNGLMVFMGHPAYVGHSETTMSALHSLVEEVKEDHTWMTNMSEVATHWNKLSSMKFDVDNKDGNYKVSVIAPEDCSLNKLAFNVKTKPTNVHVKSGSAEVKQHHDSYQIIFDATDGQWIEFRLD